jgi:hypothetical protein
MALCIGCCDGNDLPDGEWCRMCGRGKEPPPQAEPPPPKGTFARAIWDARGGHAPIPFRGYA